MTAPTGFDFEFAVQAPFRMQPGLRRLADGAPQLTPAVAPQRGPARHLREKLAVLSAFPQQALCVAPGFDAGPALVALAAHAAAEQPEALAVDGERWHARALGWALDGDGQVHEHAVTGAGQAGSPWPEVGALLRATPQAWRRAVLLSLAFAEDFAVVDADSGTLPWLAVALPSMWAPEHKVGRHFAEVHAPVADNRLVVNAAGHLLRLVCAPQRWERFVWTLTGHPRLHAHPDRLPTERWTAEALADPQALARQTWWRTERQTFIPLPERRQAVFTISVQTGPLAEAVDTPMRARRLHDALGSMSDAVLDYRGLAAVRAPLQAWLLARAAGGAGPG